jgi:hypothetical protein
MNTENRYYLHAVYVSASKCVVAKRVLEVPYEFNAALDCVDALEAGRDRSKPFGSFYNPLRYEARSVSGIAERSDF